MAAEYINRGMYDVVEVARLIGRSPDTVVSWTSSTRDRKALLVPEHKGGLFSFLDLVSLDITSRLRRRRVPLREISRAARYLAMELRTHRPLAHADLATAGAAVFARLRLEESGESEWVDAGQWGQRAFQSMLRSELVPFEYGPDRMATRWRPIARVNIDPAIQAGAPCVDRTRVPTRVLWELRQAGEDTHDLAAEYDLPLEDVLAAIEWEQKLERPLAA
jgi:uncharacterized protein (DUF433 family)